MQCFFYHFAGGSQTENRLELKWNAKHSVTEHIQIADEIEMQTKNVTNNDFCRGFASFDDIQYMDLVFFYGVWLEATQTKTHCIGLVWENWRNENLENEQ